MSYNIFMKNKFAERLTDVLNEKEISKRECARICEVSAQSVSDWTTGKIQPTAEMIYIICTKLNESADYLLGLENEAGNKIYNNNGIHNGDVNFK